MLYSGGKKMREIKMMLVLLFVVSILVVSSIAIADPMPIPGPAPTAEPTQVPAGCSHNNEDYTGGDRICGWTIDIQAHIFICEYNGQDYLWRDQLDCVDEGNNGCQESPKGAAHCV